MKFFLGLVTIVLGTTSIFAQEFNENKALNCSVAYGHYDEVAKFTIEPTKDNQKRDLTLHTLGEFTEDTCVNTTGSILCEYDGYEITVDLNSLTEDRHWGTDALTGYILNGTIDKPWRPESSIQCKQKI